MNLDQMTKEVLGDSTAIANAALTLCVERCRDLGFSPMLALVMLRMLADKNIKQEIDDIPLHVAAIMKANGTVPMDMIKEMETLVRETTGMQLESLK